MALRVEIPLVARRPSGIVATGSAATLYVYDRGTTTQKAIYAAATGGSALTQPIQADASGRFEAWVAEPGRYDLVQTIDGVALPAVPWEAVAATIEPFTALTYQNSWVNYGSGYMAGGYAKTSEGLVIVRGLAANGTAGVAIATLPAGYRPSAQLVFATMSNTGAGRIDVTTAGVLLHAAGGSGAGSYHSLNNIRFRAEA